MAGVEAIQLEAFHLGRHFLAGRDQRREIGGQEQVARAEGVAAETIARRLVGESGRSGRMAWREDHLDGSVAELDDLAVSQETERAGVVRHAAGDVDRIRGVDVNLRKLVDRRSGMIRMDMGGDKSHRFIRDRLDDLFQAGDLGPGVDQDRPVIAFQKIKVCSSSW